MYDIFKILNQSIEASSRALDQSGKIPYPVLSLVSSINPGARTIRVVDPTNPLLESPDLRRIRSIDGFDDQLPEIGSTVLVWYVEGTFDNGWFLPVQNATRPPIEKEDPIKDQAFNSPGNFTWDIAGKLRIKTPGGQTLEFKENGDILLANNGGEILIKDSGGIELNSSAEITINGKAIAVLGSRDDDGDVIISANQD